MESTKRLALKRDDQCLKKDISEGLLKLRAARGWTRKELASLLADVTVGNLHVWESQARPPRGVHLLRIARLLGLDLTAYPADSVRLAGVRQPSPSTKRDGGSRKPVINIAPMIFAMRLQSGLQAKDFAIRWNVALQTLRNWEAGHLPTGNNVALVAEQLDLPVSAISLI